MELAMRQVALDAPWGDWVLQRILAADECCQWGRDHDALLFELVDRYIAARRLVEANADDGGW